MAQSSLLRMAAIFSESKRVQGSNSCVNDGVFSPFSLILHSNKPRPNTDAACGQERRKQWIIIF